MEDEQKKEVMEAPNIKTKQYTYVEFDQAFFGGVNTEKKIREIVKSHTNEGWKLHSFNVITLQGLILFQKQRYCMMFEY